MKIIDEKGRLFGKINLIDFLAIIFLLSLTPVFYFGYKIATKKPAVIVGAPKAEPAPLIIKKNTVEVEFNFDLRRLDPQTVSLMVAGDKEIDENGQTIGEIISLEKFEPQLYYFSMGATTQKIVDPVLKHAVATLRLRVESKHEDEVYYKDKRIKYDSGIDFITDKYQVEAFYIPPTPPPKKVDLMSTEREMAALWKEIDFMKNEEISWLFERVDNIEMFLKSSGLKIRSKDDKKKR